MYVVDTSHDKEWESWQPKSRNGKFTTDVDTVVASLLLQNKSFPCVNGYSWVNMGMLIQECYGMVCVCACCVEWYVYVAVTGRKRTTVSGLEIFCVPLNYSTCTVNFRATATGSL